jgi:hypothetical protein
VLTGNVIGIQVDAPGVNNSVSSVDLGGGVMGSAGGNTFSCNTQNDLWTNAKTLAAAGNDWDHIPPTTVTTTAAADIHYFADPNVMGSGFPPSLGTRLLASPNCP